MQIKTIEKTQKSHYISLANTPHNGIETAIVIDNEDKFFGHTFFILKGDWLERYQDCKSKQEQEKLFKENYEEFGSYTSNSPEEITKITKEQVLENLEDVKKYTNEAESEEESIAIKNSWTGDIIFQSTKTTWKEAVEEAVENGANFYGANLREANLYKANLSGADLREANLYKANLRYANLHEANLSVADLREADLCRADLSGANFYGANLCEVNLHEANLHEAGIYEVNLRGATLRGADLQNAKFYGKGGTTKIKKSQTEDFFKALGIVVED
jgi:hypothetical protein